MYNCVYSDNSVQTITPDIYANVGCPPFNGSASFVEADDLSQVAATTPPAISITATAPQSIPWGLLLLAAAFGAVLLESSVKKRRK